MAENIKLYQEGGYRDHTTFTGTIILEVGEILYFNNIITGQIAAGYSKVGDGSSDYDNLPFQDVVEVATAANTSLDPFRIQGNKFKVYNSGGNSITVNVGTSGTPAYYTVFPAQFVEFTFIGGNWITVDSYNPSVPLKGLVAWHKNLDGSSTLDFGFVECNGQVLNDTDSPYNGLTIPNLNGDGGGANSPGLSRKEAMFLRGGTTSGVGADFALEEHGHDFYAQVFDRGGGGSLAGVALGATNNTLQSGKDAVKGAIGVSGVGTVNTDTETRPVNMSVVWIIRIK